MSPLLTGPSTPRQEGEKERRREDGRDDEEEWSRTYQVCPALGLISEHFSHKLLHMDTDSKFINNWIG